MPVEVAQECSESLQHPVLDLERPHSLAVI